MLGLDRSMSQPNLLHLAQLAAAAPISACPSEVSDSIASEKDVADLADLPPASALALLPGTLLCRTIAGCECRLCWVSAGLPALVSAQAARNSATIDILTS